MKIKLFVKAARLRTLPLSVSGVIMGCGLSNFINYQHIERIKDCTLQHEKDYSIFCLAILTTLGLQILSNFANDYGDGIRGTDQNRLGEARMIGVGKISPKLMRRAILITACITLLLAFVLIYIAFQNHFIYSLIFVLLVLTSIIAAIKYTVGKNAYGYSGYGDLFVFLFFGLLSTVGSYFLYTKQLQPYAVFLLATTVGLLSTTVLNLNNMRDRLEDIKHNKLTLAVKFGSRGTKIYHYTLIILALLTAISYVLINFKTFSQFLFLIAFIPLFHNMGVVAKNSNPSELDSELKKVALSVFLFAILFSIFN